MRTYAAMVVLTALCVGLSAQGQEEVDIVGDLGSETNPVRCNGPRGQREYLRRLFGPDGDPPEFYREGSVGYGPYGSIMDRYHVQTRSLSAKVYMDMYHPGHVETEPVPGFTILSFVDGQPVLPPNKAAQAYILKSLILSGSYHDLSTEEVAGHVHVFIEAGSDVNTRDYEGEIPLLVAAEYLDEPFLVVDLLLAAGADVNARNANGDTALHLLLRRLDVDVHAVGRLLDAWAPVNALNAEGDVPFVGVATALDEPEAWGSGPRQEAARLMLEAGAGRWADYFGRPVEVAPSEPDRTSEMVASLLDPAARGEALRTVLTRQLYRRAPKVPVRIFRPIEAVEVCPQQAGPPIFAVFTKGDRVIIIDADGAIVPVPYCGGYLGQGWHARDINGDGVIELAFVAGSVAYVLPVTRCMRPALAVELEACESGERRWSLLTGDASVALVATHLLTGEALSARRFEWSDYSKAYVETSMRE